jgi:hypothetical protein
VHVVELQHLLDRIDGKRCLPAGMFAYGHLDGVGIRSVPHRAEEAVNLRDLSFRPRRRPSLDQRRCLEKSGQDAGGVQMGERRLELPDSLHRLAEAAHGVIPILPREVDRTVGERPMRQDHCFGGPVLRL